MIQDILRKFGRRQITCFHVRPDGIDRRRFIEIACQPVFQRQPHHETRSIESCCCAEGKVERRILYSHVVRKVHLDDRRRIGLNEFFNLRSFAVRAFAPQQV